MNVMKTLATVSAQLDTVATTTGRLRDASLTGGVPRADMLEGIARMSTTAAETVAGVRNLRTVTFNGPHAKSIETMLGTAHEATRTGDYYIGRALTDAAGRSSHLNRASAEAREAASLITAVRQLVYRP